MVCVLDTDILTLLAHEASPLATRIRRHIAELPKGDLVVTTIVNFEEQTRGWMAVLSRARSAQDEIQIYERLFRHLANFRRITVLPYNAASAMVFELLRNVRLSVGAMDLRIASIALAAGAALVTRNISDFRRVPKLQIEDWSSWPRGKESGFSLAS